MNAKTSYVCVSASLLKKSIWYTCDLFTHDFSSHVSIICALSKMDMEHKRIFPRGLEVPVEENTLMHAGEVIRWITEQRYEPCQIISCNWLIDATKCDCAQYLSAHPLILQCRLIGDRAMTRDTGHTPKWCKPERVRRKSEVLSIDIPATYIWIHGFTKWITLTILH